MKRFLLICTLIGSQYAPASSHTSVELKLTPSVAYAPATILVKVRVEPHPGNRWYVIVIDNGSTYYRRSDERLEGEQSKATQPNRYFTGLPQGSYEVQVILFRAGEKVAGRAIERFRVLEGMPGS